MPLGHAESGRSGELDQQFVAMSLNRSGVEIHGSVGIDESGDSPRLVGYPIRYISYDPMVKAHIRANIDAHVLKEFCAEPNASSGARNSRLDPYRSRIKFLKDEAANDGSVLNRASEIDFEGFVLAADNLRRGSLVLMENGNLRAIWKDGHGTRLGLQFLGGKRVQYVIFKKRQMERSISRITGRDSLTGLGLQIKVFELASLLYE